MKKNKSKKQNRKVFLFLFTILAIFTSAFGGFLWYQARRIPDLGEGNQMTFIPLGIRNVLGSKTGFSLSPEINIRVPVLMYHYVEYVHNDPGRQSLNIPPNVLISQIDTLKAAGYKFITPNDLTPELAGKIKLPAKIAMLSFDDGYSDFYTDVFPILMKENVKAVAYIVPNFLNRPNYLFTFQLKEIAKSPLIEIGAHTMDHYALAGMHTKTATYEIAQSRKVLQETLSLPINSFAYPYGSFDQQTIKLVRDAGFTNAVSVVPGIVQTLENNYYIYRLRPGYRTGRALLDYLTHENFTPW